MRPVSPRAVKLAGLGVVDALLELKELASDYAYAERLGQVGVFGTAIMELVQVLMDNAVARGCSEQTKFSIWIDALEAARKED